MSEYERGICYAKYRREVRRQQMQAQKLIGIMLCIVGILFQTVVGIFEVSLLTLHIMFAGLWLITTKRNMAREVE